MSAPTADDPPQIPAGVLAQINAAAAANPAPQILGASPTDPANAKAFIATLNKARQIIGDVLAFSRPTGRVTEKLDPVELLNDALRLVRKAVPPSVSVCVDMSEMLPLVAINRTTFVQVLLNLSTNAVAAMNAEGTLTIVLDEAPAEPGEMILPDRTSFLRLRVRDTGCGMSKETLERAFEPFFTTKGVGQGTGLGLPVVFGLVEEMGGTIRLESMPGRGTTVTILMPSVKDH